MPYSEREFQQNQKSLQEIRQILLPEYGEKGLLLIDLDDTVKEAQRYAWTDGVQRKILPETIDAFRKIHESGIALGVATEQAFSEIEPFLNDAAKLTLRREDASAYELFNGLMIGEGGSVVRNLQTQDVRVVAPPEAQEDRKRVLELLELSIESKDEDGWGILSGTNLAESTLVKLPPVEDQGVVTISLWEKGGHVSENPEDAIKYEIIRGRIEQMLKEQGITTLAVYEAGNGTIRIAPRTASKSHTIELLAGIRAIDRSKIVYACDGPNDVQLARQLHDHGGAIIAVGNAVRELHEIADYSATLPAGRGFAQAIGAIFP